MAWSMGLLGASTFSPPAAFELIETTLISANTANITFSSLGSYPEYKHLQIRLTARSNQTDAVTGANITFNGDTTSSYRRHRLGLDDPATAVVSSSSASAVSIGFPDFVPAGGMPANAYGAAIIDILDFSSTNKTTTTRSIYGYSGGATTSNFNDINLHSGLWTKTNAVTSISIFLNSGSLFVAGSRFSLYGIRG